MTTTTLVLGLLTIGDPVAPFNSVIIWCFYLISICMTALRNDGRLTLYAGALSILQNSALVAALYVTADAPEQLVSVDYGTVSLGAQVERQMLILLMTVLTATIVYRMQRLIEDLLTLSVLESTSVAQREEVVDLEPLLQTLHQEALVLSAGRHRISLKMEGYIQLQGNPQELRSALGNLVTNAIRYTPAGGEIELRWLGTQGGGEFAVTDTGIGIAPEHIPRLTERFYRVDRGRSRETGGTGLGLAIVKHVLSHHQATLEVESQPGKGSRFAARFPAMRLRYGEEARRRLA